MSVVYTIATTWGVLALVIVALLIAMPGRPQRNTIGWAKRHEEPIPYVPVKLVDEFDAIIEYSYPQHRVEQAFRAGPFGGAK
jgi:hypothetical protein